MIELPTDLPADIVPLSWLLGVWEGTGVIDYEGAERHFSGEFAHRVSFSHDGGDYVNYAASAWLIEADGARTPLVAEQGYWRLTRDAGDDDAGPGLLPGVSTRAVARGADDVEALRNTSGGFDIEAAIVHSDGISELYVGPVSYTHLTLPTILRV